MADEASYLKETTTGFYLSVRVLPGAKRAGIVGLWDKRYVKIALRAPAVDGKANAAVVDYLTEAFNVRKNSIFWVTGQTSRCKLLFIEMAQATEREKRITWLKHTLLTEK